MSLLLAEPPAGPYPDLYPDLEAGQLALPLLSGPGRVPDLPPLIDWDVIIVCSSSGKDSMAMMAAVCRAAREQGVLHKVIVVHNDLGVADNGEPIEWPGVAELAAEHAAMFGVPLYVISRDLGGLWEELFQRGQWPYRDGRWCTSDQKTSQTMKLITRIVGWLEEEHGGPLGRAAKILYCVGLRAEESSGRAGKPLLHIDAGHSSGRRTIMRCHPVLRWTLREVWDEIKASGMRPHAAYAKIGMSRLSCSLCPLASRADIRRAVQARPLLAARYAWAETVLGPFRPGLSITELVREIHGPNLLV